MNPNMPIVVRIHLGAPARISRVLYGILIGREL
jgi:hypothetical protein